MLNRKEKANRKAKVAYREKFLLAATKLQDIANKTFDDALAVFSESMPEDLKLTKQERGKLCQHWRNYKKAVKKGARHNYLKQNPAASENEELFSSTSNAL